MIHKYASELYVVNEYNGLELDCPHTESGDLCIFPRGDVYLEQYHPNAVDNFDSAFTLPLIICLANTLTTVLARSNALTADYGAMSLCHVTANELWIL
eukprot:sb/3478886/